MSDTDPIHKPQHDVQAIRDLLDGYGNAPSILKELIQNAEDADATTFEIIHFGSSDSAPHPLLKGPALCVVNNGPFKKEHREGIFSIGIGSKAADDERIGRFGKGLKSVFSLCEAFFVLGSPQSTEGWDQHVWFMNVYRDWRHADWNPEFHSNRPAIQEHLYTKLKSVGWDQGKWLAFWFPLRRGDQLRDEKGPVYPIHHWGGPEEKHPGENERFTEELGIHFRDIARRTILLRNLKSFCFRAAESSQKLSFAFSEHSVRRSLIKDQVPLEEVRGDIAGCETVHYRGLVGQLQDSQFADLHGRSDWPTTIDPTGNSDSVGVKGVPHFGSVFSTTPSEKAELTIDWAVFLPVPTQLDHDPLPLDPKLWEERVSLVLHGCFFLDSRRTGIDGLLDGFPDPAAERSPADGKNLATQEWNRLLAHKGPLANLPKALKNFVEASAPSVAATSNLVAALSASQLWKKFSHQITQDWRFIYSARGATCFWSLEPVSRRVIYIPAFKHEGQKESEAVTRLWQLFPALAKLSDSFVLTHREGGEAGLILEQDVQGLEDEQLISLFEGIRPAPEERYWLIEWVKSFFQQGQIPREIREVLRELPLIQITSATRPGEIQWITTEEAEAKIGAHALYRENTAIQQKLINAIPDLDLYIHSGDSHLAVLLGLHLPEMNARSVADIIRGEELLGSPHQRKPLLSWMLDQPDWDNAFLKPSIRYLLHGSHDHLKDEHTQLLYEQSGQVTGIWARLIHSIVELDEASSTWRWIDAELADELSGTQCQRFGLEPVGARACLEELGSIFPEHLSFPIEEWTEKEIEDLVSGLLYADQTNRDTAVRILRRLKIHSALPAGDRKCRISIGDEVGNLLPNHLLEVDGFDQQVSDRAYPEWEELFRSATLIRAFSGDSQAAPAQASLFQYSDHEGNHYDQRLSWHSLTRLLLQQSEPHRFLNLLLNALERGGGSAIAGLGSKLRSTPLYPLENGAIGAIITADAIAHLDGLETELSELFVNNSETHTLRDLSEQVRDHPGFKKNLTILLPGPTDVFNKVQRCLQEETRWNLGLDHQAIPQDWHKFLNELRQCPEVPAADLILKLNEKRGAVSEENFKNSVLIPASKPWNADELGRYNSTLAWFAERNQRSCYEFYLRQVTSLGYLPKLLPQLQLLNQDGKWRPASDLIWPTAGPPTEHQLHEDHEKLIADACGAALHSDETGKDDGLEPQLGAIDPDTISKGSEQLVAYLKTFEHCENHPVLAASLAAVCFDDEVLLKYVDSVYLRPEGKPFSALRELLFCGEGGSSYDFVKHNAWQRSVFAFRFQDAGDASDYTTLTGGTKRISLAASPVSLLVDSRHSAQAVGRYQGRAVRELILRRFPQPDQINDLTEVWRRTLREIVVNSYQLPSALCPDFQSLRKLCGHSVQLRRVQSILLDTAESRIKELRCHSSDEFRNIMALFDEARDARLAAHDYREQGLIQQADESQELERRKRKEAEERVRHLLASTPPEASEEKLIQATRTRLEEYGYSPESTFMELFQNADDALSERLAESGRVVSSDAPDFILRWSPSQASLCVQHWGRPINQPLGQRKGSPSFKAYSRDLEKMLSLNLSDKLDSAVALTGRFGLGFKSIFFLCDHPSILSAQLNCTIRGGWYPMRPDAPTIAELRDLASKEDAPDSTTLFFLKDIHVEEAHLKQLLGSFIERAPFLVYFAKSIQHLKIDDGDQQVACKRILPDQENWQIVKQCAGEASLVVFSEDDPENAAQWIFGLGFNGFRSLPESLPNIWSTAPTQEASSIACCINGDWKLDAGRLRIAREHPSTKTVAEDLALNLRLALSGIHKSASGDWSNFCQKAGLREDLTLHQFWQSFWELVTAVQPTTAWSEVVDKQADIVGAILWNPEFGAMVELLQDCPIIPSGLEGSHRRLSVAADVAHYLSGILDDCRFLRDVCLEWPEFMQKHRPGSVVAASVQVYLDPIREHVGLPSLRAIALEDILYLCITDGYNVSVAAADRLGSILSRDKWKRLDDEFRGVERKHLRELLSRLHFPTQAGSYALASELVGSYQVTGVDEVDREETRRAAIAPPSRRLADGFSADALRFFALCREKPGANASVLATWTRQRRQDELVEVFDYLCDGQSNGELAQKLADALGREWLESVESSAAFGALSLARKQEILRLFGKVTYVTDPAPLPPQQLSIDPVEAYRLISEWWARERDTRLPEYLDRFYGSLAPLNLPWPGDDEWGFSGDPDNITARREWMILLIHAALHTEGWYRVGRHREFLNFLERNGWIGILANPNSPASEYTRILDEFLGDNPEAIVYYHSMRQFISFYASSRHLETLVESLANVDKKTQPWPLREAFSIGLNADFAGSGLVAPSFERGFGLGAHFVLRELYRLGRLSNDHGKPHAFVLPRGTRCLCEIAFGMPGFSELRWQENVSSNLHNRLQALDARLDPTFDNCFDIPLSILAGDFDLRENILGEAIVIEEDADRTPDSLSLAD